MMSNTPITILVAFDGYPDGKKRRSFAPGEHPTDLPAGYAELLLDKSLAKRRPSKTDTPAAKE
jgi:hypothetical protein